MNKGVKRRRVFKQKRVIQGFQNFYLINLTLDFPNNMPVTIQSKLLNDLQAFQALICASLFVWLFTQVWVDSVTEITSEDLNAEDEDTIPEQMEYIITQPSNGHLALKTAPNTPIMNFTQAHIDQRQLLFVHSGEISFNNLNLFLK